MRVVGLVGMRQHAIGERCVHRRGALPCAHDRGLRRAALRRRIAEREAPRRELGAGHHGGKGVEDVMARLLDHRVGQRARKRAGDVFAEQTRRRADLVQGGDHDWPLLH
jgi:hypothetical protein